LSSSDDIDISISSSDSEHQLAQNTSMSSPITFPSTSDDELFPGPVREQFAPTRHKKELIERADSPQKPLVVFDLPRPLPVISPPGPPLAPDPAEPNLSDLLESNQAVQSEHSGSLIALGDEESPPSTPRYLTTDSGPPVTARQVVVRGVNLELEPGSQTRCCLLL
jgi:hypothetical protein